MRMTLWEIRADGRMRYGENRVVGRFPARGA